MNDKSGIVKLICDALATDGLERASALARETYRFESRPVVSRKFSSPQAMRVFRRDGFVDRYSGTRLLFPGVLRLLSRVLPAEFPFQLNWRMADTHMAFWELFPTIDHIDPVARGGADSEVNAVTTSMIRNSAKSNWKLKELQWSVYPPGQLEDWDGMTDWFNNYVLEHPMHLDDPYLRRWHKAALIPGRAAEITTC